jgi:hypothetical protein
MNFGIKIWKKNRYHWEVLNYAGKSPYTYPSIYIIYND